MYCPHCQQDVQPILEVSPEEPTRTIDDRYPNCNHLIITEEVEEEEYEE